MAVEQDIAAGNRDLMNKLVVFLTTNPALVALGQNWHVNANLGTANGFDEEYYLKAPGLSGQEEIFINICAFSDPADEIYSWRCRGALGYDSNADFYGQPNNSDSCFSHHWGLDMQYTFVANGQRVIVIADFGGVTVATYLGKILPSDEPSQFPYPVFIGACSNSPSNKYSDAAGNFDVSAFMSPGLGCRFYDGAGTWRTVRNRYGAAGNASSADSYIAMSPTGQYQFMRTSTSAFRFGPVQPSPDGTYTLLPFELYVFKNHPSLNRFGYLDGVYWLTGIGLEAGNIMEIDGEDYLIIKNISRSSWEEFAAVRLV